MKLSHVSASQLDLFQRCPRSWFFQYVLKIKPPSTPAQERGTAIHSEVEHYLRTGEIRPSEFEDLVSAAAAHLPVGGKLLIEHEIGGPLDQPPGERGKPRYGIPTFEGGPRWVGFIDLLDLETHIPTVTDHKSTSNFKYCKTEDELANNTQLVSYAKYVFDLVPNANECELEHVYIRTTGKPASRVVSTVVNRFRVFEMWSKFLTTIRTMCAIAESVTDPQAVEPNTDSCGDYGGCPHLARCGVQKNILGGFVPMKKSLMEKLQQIEAPTVKDVAQELERSTSVPADSSPAQSMARVLGAFLPQSGATGVLPPDAPARETTPAEAEALAAPKKRGRPKKAQIEPLVTEAKLAQQAAALNAEVAADVAVVAARIEAKQVQAGAPTPAGGNGSAPPEALKREFIVLVNSTSLKRQNTMAALWLEPIFQRANEIGEVSDWRLLAYGPSKSVLAMALKENLATVPPILNVDSGMAGADVLVEVLAPHALDVIRATR